MSEISLDGGETMVIKALGLGGTPLEGKVLLERCGSMQVGELIEILKGLMSVGYVDSDSSAIDSQSIERIHFQVNSGYSKELKEALDPQPKAKKSERVRRE